MTKEQILEKLLTDMKLRGMSVATQDEYHTKARIFMDHFNKPADQMGETEFRTFLIYLQNERKLTPASINTYNSGLRFLFEVTLEQNLNYKRVPRQKDPILLPSVLTKDEIKWFLYAIDDDIRYEAVFMTIYGSGLRLSEVEKLRVQDIDSDQMRLFINQSKRKKDRYVPLSKTSLEALREYFKVWRPKHPDGYIFLNRDGSDHISNRAIQDAFKKYLKLARIKKHASVHTLRHSYATHLLEDGVNVFYIKELLGHATLWTTMRYLHIAQTDIMKTISPLDKIMEEEQKRKNRKPHSLESLHD